MNLFRRITKKLEIYLIRNYKKIDGWLTQEEALGLYGLASLVPRNAIIVEIGSWKGKSTFCIAKGLKKGKIFAIDPFNAEGETGSRELYEKTKGVAPLYEQFSSMLKKHGLWEKIEPLIGFSSQFTNHFAQIDFLFIDGDHSIEGCDYDYTHFSPFIKTGGFIAFHDFDPDRDDLGPTWVIKNRILNNSNYKFYRKYDSLWIAQKIN